MRNNNSPKLYLAPKKAPQLECPKTELPTTIDTMESERAATDLLEARESGFQSLAKIADYIAKIKKPRSMARWFS